jgi:hypothetical protein
MARVTRVTRIGPTPTTIPVAALGHAFDLIRLGHNLSHHEGLAVPTITAILAIIDDTKPQRVRLGPALIRMIATTKY